MLVLLSKLVRMGVDETHALLNLAFSVAGGGLTEADSMSRLDTAGFVFGDMTRDEFAALPALRTDGRRFINLDLDCFPKDAPLGLSALAVYDMLDDMPNVSMSLPRSKVNAALVSVGLSRSDLFDFCSGARFDIDWFDPLIDRVDVLSGLFGVTDLGLFPSQLPKSESESESESELESPHGKRVNINGGKDSSSEESESSKSESQPPATAHGLYRNGFSVSSLLLDRSDVDANSSESSPSISSHIVSVNSSPPPPQAAPALSPLSLESEILKRYHSSFGCRYRCYHLG